MSRERAHPAPAFRRGWEIRDQYGTWEEGAALRRARLAILRLIRARWG